MHFIIVFESRPSESYRIEKKALIGRTDRFGGAIGALLRSLLYRYVLLVYLAVQIGYGGLPFPPSSEVTCRDKT